MSAALASVPALDSLARQINDACGNAERSAREAVAHAMHAGRLLARAKEQVPHGEWERWISDHCTVAVRTAQAYMRLATRFQALSCEEAQRVAQLPLREAMTAISTPAEAPKRIAFEWAQRRDAASSVRPTLNSLRALTRDIEQGKSIRPERLDAVRKKLLGVVETLNLLEAHATERGAA